MKEQFDDYPFSQIAYDFQIEDSRGNKIVFPYEWPVVHRVYQFLIQGEQNYYNSIFLSYQMCDRNHEDYSKLYDLLIATIPFPILVSFVVKEMLTLLTYGNEYREGVFYKSSEAWLKARLLTKRTEVLIQLKNMTPKGRTYMLEQLAVEDFAKHTTLFIEHLGDSSKTVRDSMITLLSGHSELFPEVRKGLQAKKKVERESAIRIMGQWKEAEAREALRAAYELEPVEGLKAVIAEYLPADQTASFRDYSSFFTYACEKMAITNRAALDWIPWDRTSKVRASGTDAIAPVEALQYWTMCYAQLSRITVSHEGRMITQYLNTSDLQVFSMELLQLWIELGAEAKKKWVLALAATHGGEHVVHLLKRQLAEWPPCGRGAIACEAVRALAISSQDSGLMLVDNMARNFKYRQVKEAAAEAFDSAAEELGVDRETLADRIVPTLGFSERGEQTVNFGSRVFTLKLSTRLELEIYDAADKKLKVLPKPNDKDDADMAKAAAEHVKLIKKSLKTVITTQLSRLEYALASGRRWDLETWIKLFVQNPILQGFAIGMIWGSYRDDQLAAAFRYMEDGTLNTINEQEYIVQDNSRIGLIHPLELEADEIEQWKTQLEDYEIIQPIVQLNRTIHQMTEAEKQKPVITRFQGRVMHPLTLKGKMTKFAWARGDVIDGGMYYCFYKEDPRSGIGIQLNFSGAYVGQEGEFEEEVVVREAFFFHNGSAARGYVNDKSRDEGLIEGNAIPPQLFSEAIYELELITASFTEIVDES
ncbi:DUF4132 domain-containing protein [Paenibacillus mendelii]|nr:DUF4132 domain-containing protein [Paenibacillus mendelii]